MYFWVHRGRATADFTESESELGVVLRRRRRQNKSTETLTYTADGCWDGSQSTLSRYTRHPAGCVPCKAVTDIIYFVFALVPDHVLNSPQLAK